MPLRGTRSFPSLIIFVFLSFRLLFPSPRHRDQPQLAHCPTTISMSSSIPSSVHRSPFLNQVWRLYFLVHQHSLGATHCLWEMSVWRTGQAGIKEDFFQVYVIYVCIHIIQIECIILLCSFKNVLKFLKKVCCLPRTLCSTTHKKPHL